VALGVYIAVALQYGPPTMKDVLALLGFRDWVHSVQSRLAGGQVAFPTFFQESFQKVQGIFQEIAGKIPFIERFLRKKETDLVADQTSDSISLDIEEMLKSISEASLSELLDDESKEIEMVSPSHELFDDNLVKALKAQQTEVWLMGEKHVETSILKLNNVMMKSGLFSAALDRRLRIARGNADTNLAKTSMMELRDDCANYLAAQAEMTEQIKKRIDEFGELAHLAEDIEYSNMEQAAQIETTINNIDRMNPADSEDTVAQLLKELSKLRMARHRLRDHQEKAFLTVVRYEKRLETIPPQLFVDETSGLRCRIGLEVMLADWWKQRRQETRQICFALLDLVKFGEVNEEHGILIGNKVIKYLGNTLEKEFTSHDLTGIYYGNCFFVVTVNMGLRKTVTEIEKIRQGLERTSFTFAESTSPFFLKITSIVTEALPQHTDQDVMKSIEKSIVQAKKTERGLTYLQEQGGLNPGLEKVDSPNLGMDYITVDLDMV